MIYWATQMQTIYKSDICTNLMYQLTTSTFTKLLVFIILGSCLGYTISKGMVSPLFTIVLLDETFPNFLRATQMGITWFFFPYTSWRTDIPLWVSQNYWSFIFYVKVWSTPCPNPWETFPMVTYQLTTLRFWKLFTFHILWSCLGYTITIEIV